jgi:hypothetical protein
MPKSVASARATIRARRSISCCDSRPETSDSAQWTVSFHSADFGEEFGLARMLEADGRQLRLGNRRGDDR